jgi:hypothetical protein
MQFMLAVLLLISPIFAQDQAAAARAAAGCGSNEVQFELKTDKNKHPMAVPESGKAIVYIFQSAKRNSNLAYLGSVTTRVGIDGVWVGANKDNSYFLTVIEPGDHRICTNVQTKFPRFSKAGSAVSLTAEAGKIYYFRGASR